MPEAGAADSRQQGFAAIPQILSRLKDVPPRSHVTPLSPRVAGSWCLTIFVAGALTRLAGRLKLMPHPFLPRTRSVTINSTSACARHRARC